ncbi:Protein FAR1-RELATED SEQUENCE 5 [Bienertia sinuspersici]
MVTWAKEIAIQHRYLLVITSYAPQRDGRDCYLICNRRGAGCKFVIKVAERKDRSGFFIVVTAKEHEKHNNELVAYPEGHWQISGLSLEAKQLFPTDNPTVRHVYNYRDNIRRERLDGRNPAQQVLHVVVQRGYVYWTATDMDGCICQLFCAHSTSVQLFRTWLYVVGMDSTYALLQNKSSESYQWVLDCFENILGESMQLSAIVTDRDLGLTKELAQVFPHTTHLLCTWHINKDVANRVQQLYGDRTSKTGESFENGKWRLVMNAVMWEEFDHAWTSLIDSYSWFPTAVSYV